MKFTSHLVALAALVFVSVAVKAETKPKYGSKAIPLSVSHDYFKGASAPDFWALIPFYVPQFNDAACSVASITMAVNAARGSQTLGTEDELATQTTLLSSTQQPRWENFVLGKGHEKLVLEDIGAYAKAALEGKGIKVAEVVILRAENPPAPEGAPTAAWKAFKEKAHAALLENEKSSKDFILANFDQKALLEDASVGHVAPVGAFDAKKGRVLILDPDRKWYEPYWVPEATFLEGLATVDTSVGKNRGLVWIKLAKP